MRYLVYGYYGYGNFGDDLLLRAVIEGIPARDSDASFRIHSLEPVSGFEDDARVSFTGLARWLPGIRRHPWRVFAYLVAFAKVLEAADIMVIGGGTLFIDKGRLNPSLALLYLMTLYARLRGKPVIIIGVAVDDLTHRVSIWLTRQILSAAEFVAMRDTVSLSYAECFPPKKVCRSADLVLGLDIGAVSNPSVRRHPTVGLCFIDYFRTIELSDERHTAYLRAIENLIERHRDKWDFVVVTFQRGIGQRDDWLTDALSDRFNKLPAIEVDSIQSARDMAARVDVLVTTRFHLGILAVMWEKPAVIIDHERKMTTLASDFALPSVTLETFLNDPIDLGELIRAFDPEKTKACLVIEQSRVEANFSWLEGYC